MYRSRLGDHHFEKNITMTIIVLSYLFSPRLTRNAAEQILQTFGLQNDTGGWDVV